MSSVDSKAEGSSSSTKNDATDKIEVMKKADELLAQGKRNMVCGEVPKAVNNFEEAVKLLVENCGEMSRDCADAYFHCGGALLELCRMESSVLGSALDGVDIEEEKEEKESEQFEKPPADDEDKTGDEENEEADDGETGEENEAEGEKDEDGDDVSHFQLAWEYLDLAKVIYQKSEEKEDQLKAAECLLKLGELSMENEQHETAAIDLESALTIQKKVLQNDDRIIAETHYQLGLAYGLGKEFEKAINQYQQAILVIEAKIVSLTKLIEDKEVDAGDKENKETDGLMKYKNEVKDLKELLPEMKNKIEDTKVEQRDMSKIKEAFAKEMLEGLSGLTGTTKGFGSPKKASSTTNGLGGSGSSTSVDENGEAKAKPIAHLVRKKRKNEEEETSTSPQEVKKIRQEETNGKTNGVSKINGTGDLNGHEDKKKTDQTASTPASEPMST